MFSWSKMFSKMSSVAFLLGIVFVTQPARSPAKENKCIVTDSMGLGNKNCTFNEIPTHPCWYTLECSAPAGALWEAWCTTAVAYLKQKGNVNEQRWKNRCLRKIDSRLTFNTSRTAVEICKQVDSSCHRKRFIQFNGTSIRKVRWCNCSSGNTGNGTKISSSAARLTISPRFSQAGLLKPPSPSSSPSLSPLPPSLSQSPDSSLSPSLATSTSSLLYPSLHPPSSLSLVPLFSPVPSPSPSLLHSPSMSLLPWLPLTLSQSPLPLPSVLPSPSTSSPPLPWRSPVGTASTTLSPSSQQTATVSDGGLTHALIDNLTQDFNKMRGENLQAEEIFQILTSFEDTIITYSLHRLNGSSPFIHNSSEIFLRVQRISSRNSSNFHLETAGNKTLIKVPSENADQNGSVVLGIVYKQLHKLLPTAQTDSSAAKKARRLNSNIMAVVMYPKPKTLRKNITLKFPKPKAVKGDCMFWDTSNESNPQHWSGSGCREMPSKSSSEGTECTCNHLTHFAVLFNYGYNQAGLTDTDTKTLDILTYVGLALSITGAILTIISYVILTDVHQPLSQIRVSLAGSLGAAQIVFLAGINRTENTKACVVVAALMQYFLMAAFCWMLVEGIYLYLFVVKVYNVSTKVKIYHGLSWGFPVVMVAISLSIAAVRDGIHSFVSKDYCWMSSNNKLIWIFVAFVATIEFINVVILVRVVREMTTMQHAKDNVSEQIRIGIKACVVMVPLLGVTWLFGFLAQLHKSFFYIFTILNSIQGFLIFLLHCVRNSQIRERLKTRMFAKSPARTERKHAVTTLEVKHDEDEAHPCLFELQ